MARNYTVVAKKRGDNYVARVHELPGVTAQGKTRADAVRQVDRLMQHASEENRRFAARSKSRSGGRK